MSKIKCPKCGGRKTVSVHDKQIGAEFKGGDYNVPCPTCNGTGEIDLLLIAHCEPLVRLYEKKIRELEEELRVGNSLTAKLTDRCRELEALLESEGRS